MKIFRKQRLKLAAGNKLAKYLRYAFGEILLVVIGILIALQVNNWNERQKDLVFEREILGQIRENLIRDKASLVEINKINKKALYASTQLTDSIKRITDRDSIPYWLADVARFTRFHPITNSYEVLKSKGLEIISNNNLRLELGKYYDDQVNQTIQDLGDIEFSFNNQWLPLLEKHVKEFNFGKIVVLDDENAFFRKTRALKILILNYDNYNDCSQDVTKVIDQIDKILTLLPEKPKSDTHA
ncbi:MAG: hypothetical protein JXR71_08430 [Bacteroidales bacterium]|nr:hypothetical protein [Bacteroidales bacterium]